MLHEYENSQDTQEFLKSNGKKFQGDCLTAMRLMFSGIIMTSQDCWEKYKIHDRRLRNCYAARPDIVKKRWVMKANGTRSHVEYWIDKFQPPTKAELQEWFSEHQNEQPVKYKKGEKTAADFALKIIKGGKQTELFS